MTLREKPGDGAPVTGLTLRPLRRSDADDWLALRARNARWLDRWEATTPEDLGGDRRPGRTRWQRAGRPPTFAEYVAALTRAANDGSTLPFAIELHGELVGQLTVSSITYGSLCSASIGYWVSEHVAGRGVVPTAVAMATDHCFFELGLHRIEVNIRPENAPSLRVVEKLGLRDEGVRVAYLHIQGRWCDHRTFALTAEEVPDGLLARWRRAHQG
ncbi:GNAT family N-acetyltransferase [Sanguibacter sp. YZGR15]|uniref:GNAT family N-acetyltransferase n=1 Tax=Sanguibacter suaedae TaxID=2795737 RepID=A0A934I3N6_9MICO|nr:GNAT family protein [Sanguibacter suaedae]MBI9114648.1 GNAT family N-acetyltransferase [Sanguibacter suaedae]